MRTASQSSFNTNLPRYLLILPGRCQVIFGAPSPAKSARIPDRTVNRNSGGFPDGATPRPPAKMTQPLFSIWREHRGSPDYGDDRCYPYLLFVPNPRTL